jgi:hypothetical protein
MSELPPESRLWNLERGALTTKALAIVADLGVADALATAAFAMGEAGPAWTARLHGFEAMTIAGDEVLATPGFVRLCGGRSLSVRLRTSELQRARARCGLPC